VLAPAAPAHAVEQVVCEVADHQEVVVDTRCRRRRLAVVNVEARSE
jgi:hypothetical protein